MTKLTQNKVFFISWIIEAYKRIHKIPGKDASVLFQAHNINEWLYENYDVLHTVSEAYVVNEIDEIIEADNVNTNKR